MIEPIDPGVITFQHDRRQMKRAIAIVKAAVKDLCHEYPPGARKPGAQVSQHALDEQRERAKKVTDALTDRLSRVELAVAEFLSREAQERTALDVAAFLSEAQGLSDKLRDLMGRIGDARRAFHWAEAKGSADDVADGLALAHGYAIDGLQDLHRVTEALADASRHMPADTRGRAGAMGRLTVSADAAFYLKLCAIWKDAGLTTATGNSGGAIDVFLFHTLRAAWGEKALGGRWLEKLREKANRQLSTENDPPK